MHIEQNVELVDRLTPDEQRVPGEHGSIISILEKVADAVLGMARCVQCLDLDATD